MSNNNFILGLAVAAALATPAFATVAQAQAPKPAAAAPAQNPPSRATLLRNLGTSFKAVDTNGDGTLNIQEVNAAEARRQQAMIQQVQTRYTQEFGKLDTDKNGQLSLAEFRAMAPQPKYSGNAGQLALQKLDKNKDGKVSADEYRAPMLAGFDQMDTNKDGTLSQAERQAQAAKTAQAQRQN